MDDTSSCPLCFNTMCKTQAAFFPPYISNTQNVHMHFCDYGNPIKGSSRISKSSGSVRTGVSDSKYFIAHNYSSFLLICGLICVVYFRIVLYCIVLYCVVLHRIVQCYILLFSIVLCRIVLCCTVLYRNVLQNIVLYCIVLYCIASCCIVLYCTIVLHCIVLYCIVLYSIVFYCICFINAKLKIEKTKHVFHKT